MPDLTPICAFDISPAGVATACAEASPPLVGQAGGGYRWVHYDRSQPELAAWLNSQLPATPARALLQKETRPRCDSFDGGLIVNLRGANLNPGAEPEDMVSVRLWVAEGLVVSARTRKLWALDDMRKQMITGDAPVGTGGFLADLTNRLTARIEQISIDLEEETDALEEKMIEHFHMLGPQVAPIRQSVIKLRRFVGPQREALNRLSSLDHPLIGKASLALLRETSNRVMRTVEELDSTRERLAAIQEHLDVQHSIVMGRNSYVLSIVAAIFLPLGFLTGLFGVNVGGMPGLESPYAFAILSGMSVIIGLLLFLIFRLSKWL